MQNALNDYAKDGWRLVAVSESFELGERRVNLLFIEREVQVEG